MPSHEENSRFRDHYERMMRGRLPRLSRDAGNFMLWYDILGGYLQRASDGERWSSDLFGPDEESVAYADALRSKAVLNEDEKVFLEYFDFLVSIAEELRQSCS